MAEWLVIVVSNPMPEVRDPMTIFFRRFLPYHYFFLLFIARVYFFAKETNIIIII